MTAPHESTPPLPRRVEAARGQRPRLAVLVSGNGSNLQAIIDAAGEGTLAADVALVVSNRKDAFALERAKRAGIAAQVLLPKQFSTREAFDAELARVLQGAAVDWVVLAGFMRLLGPAFLEHFQHRTINLHPSLLPSFPGTDAIAQAFEYGVRVTGCTVHLIDEGMDTGPIIDQRAVERLEDDTVDSLAARIHRAEHELLVSVLRRIATGGGLLLRPVGEGRQHVGWPGTIAPTRERA